MQFTRGTIYFLFMFLRQIYSTPEGRSESHWFRWFLSFSEAQSVSSTAQATTNTAMIQATKIAKTRIMMNMNNSPI